MQEMPVRLLQNYMRTLVQYLVMPKVFLEKL